MKAAAVDTLISSDIKKESEDTKVVIAFVNQRRTVNTMTKRNSKKTSIYKTLHIKLKIDDYKPHKHRGELI